MQMQIHDNLCINDLRQSGLEPQDVAARPITPAEISVCKVLGDPAGYVMPYFDLHGEPMQYYRIRLFDTTNNPKYKQPAGAQNHIYFPKGLKKLFDKGVGYCLITEGEKKAAAAVKQGYPCIAVSGVYNWRNRIIEFPEASELKAFPNRGKVQAKIPQGDPHSMVVEGTGTLAIGLSEFIDFAVQKELKLIIVFDTDKEGLKPDVQKAAANLGYELRYRGLNTNQIRHFVLPPGTDGKMGLDDYLMARGTKEFTRLIRTCLNRQNAFPRHPNPKSYIASQLQRPKMSRKQAQDAAMTILMELEARGKRLRNVNTKEMFYFDRQTHTLMQVNIADPKVLLHSTAFGAFLYREFNLANVDMKVIQWLAAQYNGEPGIEDTETHKVFALFDDRPNWIAYQLSDSHYAIVTPDPDNPIKICTNGTYGILFEQNQVEPLDPQEVEVQFYKWHDSPPKMLWYDVLKQMSFRDTAPLPGEHKPTASGDDLRLLATLLFYMSPWIQRWQGTQLPVELVIAEAGSGKSTLYGLRQTIISGHPKLSNITNDVRDWYAGISSRGGLYVMDNVHFTGSAKDYRQRVSDELCRLITEPDPHVEMRKLYTTNDSITLPISCTFAVTAIEQPFYNTDLLQRAAIFELQAIEAGHDSHWADRQLKLGGGRVGWIGHQLNIVHRFLCKAVAKGEWNPDYRAGHRLVNYEQALVMMGEVFGINIDWIPSVLSLNTQMKMSENDWTMEGLSAFLTELKNKHPKDFEKHWFGAGDIVAWAESHEVHRKNHILTNAWRLGKYLRSHKSTLERAIGMYEAGKKANRQVFNALRTKNDTKN